MDHEEFSKYVEEAINTLPSEFAEKLENVAIIVEDRPSREQLQKLRLRGNRLLLGLYEGIPKTRRGRYGIGPTLPDKITIFRLPILAITRSQREIISQIRSTVLHEIAHHFGMSEEEIHQVAS